MTASLATAGRVGALVSAPFALLALLLAEVFEWFKVVDVVATLGCVTLAALAIASLVAPRRWLDAASLLVIGMLAGLLLVSGSEFAGGIFAYGPADAGGMLAVFAWLFLTATGICIVAGLAVGDAEQDERLTVGVQAVASRARRAAAVAATAPGPTAAPAPASAAAVPGWYPDADGETLRWWDGAAWTEHVQPRPQG